MFHIAGSTIFFICLCLSDYSQVKRKKYAIVLSSILAYGGLAIVLISLGREQMMAPGSGSFFWGKTLLLALAGLSLFYVLFIEISLFSEISSTGERLVFRRGTYSLVRHPGFYPFMLLIASLYLYSPGWSFLLKGVYLILLNLLTIYLEDRFFFPRLFRDYNDYKTSVPFLLPGMKKGER